MPGASREYLNDVDASGDGGLGRARLGRSPLSIAGLLAVILVMAGGHVVVAHYNMLAMDLARLHLHSDPTTACDVDATPSPGAGTATPTDRPARPRPDRSPRRRTQRRPARRPRCRSRRGTARSA